MNLVSDLTRQWLLSKNVTIWGQFDLSQPERLEEAVDWWMAQRKSWGQYLTEGFDRAV